MQLRALKSSKAEVTRPSEDLSLELSQRPSTSPVDDDDDDDDDFC